MKTNILNSLFDKKTNIRLIKMLITIPQLTTEDIVQYGTTFKITTDVAGTNVLDTITKTTGEVTVWDTDLVIPTGEIYYVHILRLLRNIDGVNINNENWIGPDPIYSNESQLNDALVPKFKIEVPYIQDVNLIANSGLTITLEPYTSDTEYLLTALTLSDLDGNIISNIKHDMDVDGNTVLFDKTVTDFSQLTAVNVEVIHFANHSTISSCISEVFTLGETYYTVIGDTKDIDPLSKNLIKLKGISAAPISISEATIIDKVSKTEITCDVEGDTIIIPTDIVYDRSYTLDYSLSYHDHEGVIRQTTGTTVISTMNNSERMRFDTTHVFKNKIEHIASEGLTYTDLAALRDDIKFNTEELFTNLIPMVGASDKLDLAIFDQDAKTILTAKVNSKTLNVDNTIRLIDKKYTIIQTVSSNKPVLQISVYDPYDNVFTTINTKTFNIYNPHADVPSFIEFNNEVYVCGINYSDRTKFDVYRFNYETGGVTLLTSMNVGTTLSTFAVGVSANDHIVLFPSGGNIYKYIPTDSFVENNATKSYTLPSSFINRKNYVTSLINGDIFVIRSNSLSNILECYIINTKDSEINIISNSYSGGGMVNNITELRNGNILFKITTGDSHHLYQFN